jgi:TFIIF-interacting CTD phosphatase-like protein
VNLNGCIIATVYDSEAKRWVTYKRPGLDLFLERISQKYELVVWSNYGMDNALDVVGRLDPEHQYFHDTITKEIEHPGTEKDLQYLGRPLQRIIVMDHKPNANPQYTNNTIVIPEWTGGVENMAQDRTLYNILPFLDHLSTQQQVFDLPKLVGAYTALAEKEDKPLPFAFLDLYEKRKAEKPAWKFWA